MASGVISHPPHYERCSMQFPQSCTNVVRSEYKNDMKYMTQINVFKFSHSIIYLPFIYFFNYLDLRLVQIVVCPEDGGDDFLRNLDDT